MVAAFPLLPILNFIVALLLFYVLIGRLLLPFQFGITILCLCLFVQCIIYGVNMVLWSDNVDIKAVVWCDIGEYISLYVSVSDADRFRSQQ